jgi:hypothetical protein
VHEAHAEGRGNLHVVAGTGQQGVLRRSRRSGQRPCQPHRLPNSPAGAPNCPSAR